MIDNLGLSNRSPSKKARRYQPATPGSLFDDGVAYYMTKCHTIICYHTLIWKSIAVPIKYLPGTACLPTC